MNVAVADEDIVGVVELLGFVAEFCHAQDELVSAALARFVGVASFGSADLAAEAVEYADLLARLIGCVDSSLEPAP